MHTSINNLLDGDVYSNSINLFPPSYTPSKSNWITKLLNERVVTATGGKYGFIFPVVVLKHLKNNAVFVIVMVVTVTNL